MSSIEEVTNNNIDLGDPVELKYTEYYNDDDSNSDSEHDPVILLHGK